MVFSPKFESLVEILVKSTGVEGEGHGQFPWVAHFVSIIAIF